MYFIYKNLPVSLQNLVCTIYGYKEKRLRFNSYFYGKLEEFIASDFYDLNAIESTKKSALTRVLMVAKKSGFYPFLDKYDSSFIKSNPLEILSEMPVLTKDQLREFDLSNVERKAGAKTVITSGTTGKALKLIKDKSAFAAQWAVWFRHRSRFGISLGDLSVNFTGKPVVPMTQKKPPYWRFNKAQNQYLISMQHINEENIESIVSFLNTIKPDFYSGYPSIISEVSRLASLKDLKLNDFSVPKVVFTGAENLLSNQEESIINWLGSDVVLTDQYGLSEGNCNFSKCEHGNYHEDFEFCHVEIIAPEFLDDGSIKGRLIGTSFYNKTMPLIRYDTGDIAIMAAPNFRCPCGRESQVFLSVEGRVDDYVLLPDNKRVMRFDYLFKDTFEVLEAQVIQHELLSVEIRAVLNPGASSSDFEKKVKEYFSFYIHQDFNIFFKYVDEIEKSSTGKFKAVVNRLN